MSHQPAPDDLSTIPQATDEDSQIDRYNIVLRALMTAIIVVVAIFYLGINFDLSPVPREAAERNEHEFDTYYGALLGFGMLLTVAATCFSLRAALAIGLMTIGCAITMPFLHEGVDTPQEPVLFTIGTMLILGLTGMMQEAETAPRWPSSPFLPLASSVAMAAVIWCWFLAGLTENLWYLLGAAVALTIPRWLPYSWAGCVTIPFVAWFGYVDVTTPPPYPWSTYVEGIPPYLRVEDLFTWFALPAGLVLAGFLGACWLVDRRRLSARARRVG